MRNTIVLAALPIALGLSACADSTPADEVTPEPMEAAEVPVELPKIPANSLVTIDYPGTYTQAGPDGGISSLTLKEDMTYEFTRPDGETITGTYSGMEDGSRIRLDNFQGGPAYFSVGSGAIYRLANESTPYTEVTAEGEFTRDVAATPPAATEAPAAIETTPPATTEAAPQAPAGEAPRP